MKNTETRSWTVGDAVLTAVLCGVAAYGLFMVLFGAAAADVFGMLGFGAADAGISGTDQREYVFLLQSVIGAVLVGWMVLAIGLAIGPVRRRERWAWKALVASLSAWFALDTGFSLLTGQVAHAAFNCVFAAVLAVAVWAVRPSSA